MSQNLSAEFIQVYEALEGETYWLLCHMSDDVDVLDLTGFSLFAKPKGGLDFDICSLEEGVDSDRGGRYQIISLTVKKPIIPFEVDYNGVVLATMKGRLRDEMLRARDSLMVNPGIDGRYTKWLERSRSLMKTADCLEKLSIWPLMSVVVPLYNTPALFLRDLLSSIVRQIYPNWELVLVNASPENEVMREVIAEYDDERITVVPVAENLGIVGNTNIGIARTTGDYVSFVDHDDVVEPDMLLEFVLYLEEHPNAGLIYCDEDSFDFVDGNYYSALFKPELNREYLLTHNYVVHCLTLSRKVLEQVELSTDESNGAQDYDLTLKALDCGAEFGHVPRILYHWRSHMGSTNGGKKAVKPYAEASTIFVLQEHFKRASIEAYVRATDIPYVFETKYKRVLNTAQLVIACKDLRGLRGVLASVAKCAASMRLDVVVVGTTLSEGSRDDLVEICPGVEFVSVPSGTTVIDVVNLVIESSECEVVVLCNDSVRWVDEGTFDWLCSVALLDDVGISFPKGCFADGLNSSCGLCISDGRLIPLNVGFTGSMGGGYLGYAEMSAAYSAASPGCLAFRKSVFRQVGGLSNIGGDEIASCADFSFKVRNLGLSISYVPYAPIINHSMPIYICSEQRLRHQNALEKLWAKWGDGWRQEVLGNPNIDFSSGYPRLNTVGLDGDNPSLLRKVIRRVRRKLAYL